MKQAYFFREFADGFNGRINNRGGPSPVSPRTEHVIVRPEETTAFDDYLWTLR
jgi:hypothetical protein